MYQANSSNNSGYPSISNPVGGQSYNNNTPAFFNNNYNNNINQNISYSKQPLSTIQASQSQPQMYSGNNKLSSNNANPLMQDTPNAQQTQPVARYAYTGNIGNASPRTQQLAQQQQQQQQTSQIQYSANIPPPKTLSQQQQQQSSQSQGYLQNPQVNHQAFENNNYDSFSGSMVDEGISTGGGANFMPESKQIYGSKQGIIPSDAFLRGSGSPSHQMATHQFQPTGLNPQRLAQQQSNSQVNDLAYQLNQIRIASKQPKENNVPEELTNSNAFKIVNKDTGEVFDIRQFDGDQKKNINSNNIRSPLHSNNINISQPSQPMQNAPPQQQTQSQQVLHTAQQPLTFQQAGVYQTASSSNINSNTNSNNTNAWTEWWNKKRKNNGDLLLQAKINNTNACLELLDKKQGDMRADVNAKDASNEWTSLHYGCQNGNTKLVSQLLYYEATIDSESAIQQTPLIIAAISGYEDISQLLITAGADINFQDSNGNTPLHHACLNGNKKIVEMLLKKPSLDWKCLNKQGKEPYELCKDEEIKKAFDNFFVFQKAMMKKNPRVRIFNANQDTVNSMFSHNNTNSNAHSGQQQQSQNTGNFFGPNIKQQQEQQQLENQLNSNYLSAQKSQSSENKSSFGTSDADTSNMSDEEKVGPNSFIVHGLIGKGSFGEVYLVEKKDSQQLYAMKVLHKSKIMRHNLTRYALTERNVLSVTKHPFIVRLNYAFQTPDKLFLILKYCPGGDLGEHLQKEKRFTEDRVKNYLAEITLALEHLHKKDVIFRDLKPDNIVLDHEGHAMLTDFGLSKEGVLDHSTGAKSFCGSVAYLAPEMLKRCGHGKAVDWYLLGVVMYELLVGIPPYYANNKEELFDNIEKGHLKLPSFLTADARSLLKALLQRNPVKRLGSGKGDADEIKAHPFFASIVWEDAEQRKLNVPIPNRKIRISTKFDPNVFEPSSFVENGKEYIPGWSFVDHNADQVNYNLNQQ